MCDDTHCEVHTLSLKVNYSIMHKLTPLEQRLQSHVHVLGVKKKLLLFFIFNNFLLHS